MPVFEKIDSSSDYKSFGVDLAKPVHALMESRAVQISNWSLPTYIHRAFEMAKHLEAIETIGNIYKEASSI